MENIYIQHKGTNNPKGRPVTPTLIRFEKFINKTVSCWLWTGNISNKGYATFKQDYRKQLAHRISYSLYKNEIPEGLVIDHLCRVRHCVNPEHLEAVTNAENLRRRPPFKIYGKWVNLV